MGLQSRAKGSQPCWWGPKWAPGPCRAGWDDCGAYYPKPQPLTSFPQQPQEPGQGWGGLFTFLHQEWKKK